MLLLGTVPYANAAPLLEGLEADPGVRLVRETPARLAARMEAGDLDAGLLPSVEYLRHPGRVLLDAGCIASEGPVASVSLLHRRPLARGVRVLVDRSSRTSAALLRLLLDGPLGAPGAVLGECAPDADLRGADADALLLIGDAALRAPRGGLGEVDLGEVWTAWTGLPFVWAAWVARDGEAARRAGPILAEARRRGREALPGIAAREAARVGLPRERMERYLTENIRYDLGVRERAGLERFRGECARAGVL